jgi:hypothetical protein
MLTGITHHVEVSNSEVYHSGWHAGINAGGDDLWILNNYIHDNGGFNDPDQYNTSHGIYYSDGSRGVVANNILEHNRAKGLSSARQPYHRGQQRGGGNGRSGGYHGEHARLDFANNVVANNGNVNDGVGIHTSVGGGVSHIEINNSGTTAYRTITGHERDDHQQQGGRSAPRVTANSMPSTTHQGYTNTTAEW